jgi:phosphoribosyl 1,2-cyclic phosphodiesterase/CheY-like chemotaxis protein
MQTALIIDDDTGYRQLLAEMLQAHGWRVRQAGAGEEGIALAKKHRPQVVLCDLMMPRGTGFQVCRALHAEACLRQTRIIVTSGRDFSADRKAARVAGADDYLVKPFSVASLIAALGKSAQSPADNPPARLRFWGVRGSVPTPGHSTVRYGGNTSCVELRIGEQIIVLDGGTGLRLLGCALAEEFTGLPLSLTLLLTHTHWDHIQGLPFFRPLYDPKNRIHILGYEGARQGLVTILSNQMESPYFPIGLGELPSNMRIEELRDLNFNVGTVRVEACFANHPGVCVGYRLFAGERSLAFFPDNEPRFRQHTAQRRPGARPPRGAAFARGEDRKLVNFLRGVDVLIMDAQYDCAEYREHVGWGHGCVDDVVRLALAADAKRLFLFHHDPDHDDAKVASLERHARRLVAAQGGALRVDAACEGLSVDWSPDETRKPARASRARRKRRAG